MHSTRNIRSDLPSRVNVEAFVADVLSNDHVGAIQRWYAEAWMQGNRAAPRTGRDRLAEGEAASSPLGKRCTSRPRALETDAWTRNGPSWRR